VAASALASAAVASTSAAAAIFHIHTATAIAEPLKEHIPRQPTHIINLVHLKLYQSNLVQSRIVQKDLTHTLSHTVLPVIIRFSLY
jgi:hypothetical protein